jgi:hypothetical protein
MMTARLVPLRLARKPGVDRKRPRSAQTLGAEAEPLHTRFDVAIAADGRALIGHGVVPDVVLLPRESDLLAGRDTLHEAALAWLREELEP